MSHKFKHYAGSWTRDICGRCGMTGLEIIQHGNKYCWHRQRKRGGERDYRDEMRRRLSRRAYMRWLGKRKTFLRTPIQRLIRERTRGINAALDDYFADALVYGIGTYGVGLQGLFDDMG